MKGFISYADLFRQFFESIISSSHKHAKWLNTLSYLENCGARKIALCEHPVYVKEEMLKHASEEFRHAHYLKRQIPRLGPYFFIDYSMPYLLGGTNTLQYLNALDMKACRYLSQKGLSKADIKNAAYCLVTYTIELRAEELYPLYNEILRLYKSPISVKSIILEEKEHLEEMRMEIAKLKNGSSHSDYICAIESELCFQWLKSLLSELTFYR